MQDQNIDPLAAKRIPWNKGKLTGAKPPLRPKHVWAIRTKLQVEGRKRDLALFNLAVDSKLRGCDNAVRSDTLNENPHLSTKSGQVHSAQPARMGSGFDVSSLM